MVEDKLLMRLLAIADTHFGYESGKSAEARKFTYESMFNKFEEIIAIAKKQKVDAILHAGDFFNRSAPRKKVLKRSYELVERILLEDIDFLIIPGNHERAKLPESLLSFHKRSHFFNKLSIVDLEQCSIVGFPFIRTDPQSVAEKINKLLLNEHAKPNIVLCHQLFEGATFGPHQFVFRKRHGAINITAAFKDVSLIISGHVHRAQVLFDGLVVYPGSIERTSFVEFIEPKGYLLIDIESNFSKVQFHTLTSLPMDVIELPVQTIDLDYDSLLSTIKPGLHRTLLRLTGRKLTTAEIENLRNFFPSNEYPLLVISPRFPEYSLKPLYTNKVSFDFPAIIKNF
ncbi:MAG: metallophosphoesterase family protein [Candidatus Heimdallarchaeota archaeon]